MTLEKSIKLAKATINVFTVRSVLCTIYVRQVGLAINDLYVSSAFPGRQWERERKSTECGAQAGFESSFWYLTPCQTLWKPFCSFEQIKWLPARTQNKAFSRYRLNFNHKQDQRLSMRVNSTLPSILAVSEIPLPLPPLFLRGTSTSISFVNSDITTQPWPVGLTTTFPPLSP